MPLVSIITPAYNSAAYIRETIRSVRQQSVTDWEHLIIDDGSEDETLNVIRSEADGDDRIRVLRLNENKGAAHARNAGIEEARGRYIAFIDSDDIWLPDKLERQLALFERESVPLVYAGYYRLNDRTGERRLIKVPPHIDYAGLLNSTVIATLTAVYDTQATGKVYMPDIRKRQDYGLWLRILRAGGRAAGVTEPLAVLRKREGSLSSNKLSAMWHTWRIYRDYEGLSFMRSSYHFVNYMTRAWLKSL